MTRRTYGWRWGVLGVILSVILPSVAATHQASSVLDIRTQAPLLMPGDVMELAPGVYAGEVLLSLQGTLEAPITICARDPRSPPRFEGGRFGIRLAGCRYLRLRHLVLSRFADGGIQVVPGSTPGAAQHLVLEDLAIRESGTLGNAHALALTHVADVIVRRCAFEAWGGAGINIAASQRVHVEECRFTGREGASSGCGIAVHSGSSHVLVQTSHFRWAGDRAIILGGQPTPSATPTPDAGDCEASHIEIAGNRFFGGLATVTWLAARDSQVHHNSLILPHHAALSLLLTRDETLPETCRGGLFTWNIILLDQRVIRAVSLTERTRLDALHLSSNLWYRAGGKPVRLLVAEADGIRDLDPGIVADGSDDYRVTSSDPRLADMGADAYQPRPAPFALP